MQEKDYRVLPNFASRIKAKLPLKVVWEREAKLEHFVILQMQ